MAPEVKAVTKPVWVGEGPHWSHTHKALFFISVYDKTINKYDPATGEHTKAKIQCDRKWDDFMADVPGFIIPVEGTLDQFVVGEKRRVVVVQWDGKGEARELRQVAEVDQHSPDNRINDAKADTRGRLFLGTMGAEYELGKFHLKKGSLYRIDADGSVHQLDKGFDISNGLCCDEKEKAFYFIDSFEYTIRKYDYDIETGNISNPKLIFKLKDHGVDGIADGMTIDTDGNLWVANFDGSQVLKIDPRKGEILEKVPTPALQTTSVTWGGEDLDELYVTSACINYGQEQLPPCGSVFRVRGLHAKGFKNNQLKL